MEFLRGRQDWLSNRDSNAWISNFATGLTNLCTCSKIFQYLRNLTILQKQVSYQNDILARIVSSLPNSEAASLGSLQTTENDTPWELIEFRPNRYRLFCEVRLCVNRVFSFSPFQGKRYGTRCSGKIGKYVLWSQGHLGESMFQGNFI